MKKVLSVAMASAMVLGMGANAFAIQYASGSSDTAAWPAGFQFDGKMFVTNKDGDIVTGSNTKLDGKTRINFNEGDVIWMPLYANNQKEYTVVGAHQGYDKVEATTVSFDPVLWDEFTAEDLIAVDADATVKPFEYRDNQNKVLYWYNRDAADTASYTGSHGLTAAEVKAGWRIVKIPNRVEDRYGKMVENVRVLLNGKDVTGKGGITDAVAGIEYDSADVKFTISYDAANDVYHYTIVAPGGTTCDLNNPGDVANLDGTWMYKEGSTTTKYGPASVKHNVTYEEFNTAVPAVVKELAKLQPGTAVGNNVVTLTNVAPEVDTGVVLKAGVEVVANLPEVAAVSEDLGEIEENNWETDGNYVVNTVKYGHYTGNIDKNWSINLIEEDNGVADLVEKAELYKADEVDYLSYKDYTSEIMPNAVYLKVTLKDTWKLAKAADMKYYVYVADNKSNKNTTNKVWVSGIEPR